jgi:hypothetical protein
VDSKQLVRQSDSSCCQCIVTPSTCLAIRWAQCSDFARRHLHTDALYCGALYCSNAPSSSQTGADWRM